MKKILLLALSFCVFACGSSPSKQETQKPTILVSLAPYAYLTKKVVGDLLEVHTVVPQSANPHAYEPSMHQMREMRTGAVWFRIGEFFEGKLLPALKEQNPNLVDMDLREGISLLHHSCCAHDTAEDRHIWLSPQNAIVQTEIITQKLSQVFPEYREEFEANAALSIQELQSLDVEIKEILRPVQQRSFFVSHSAFAYFCKSYDLTQISLEFHGKEPTAAHLAEVLQEIQIRNTQLAISMPQHSNKGLEIIAQKLHLTVRAIDPYSENYLETMRLLAHTIAGS